MDKRKKKQHEKDKKAKSSATTATKVNSAVVPATNGENPIAWMRPKSNLEVKALLCCSQTFSRP
jgi:hypothetical protein